MIARFLCAALALLLVAPIAWAQAPAEYFDLLLHLLELKIPDNRTVNIVFHGHSVPAEYFKTPVVDTFDSYPHLVHEKLKERYPFAVINVIVTAKGSETSEGGAARFGEVLAFKPDVVFIDYALNDRSIGLERARVAWEKMITAAKAQRALVVLMTPTPDLTAKLDDPTDPVNQHAAQIRSLAEKYHIALVDSLAAFKAYAHAGGKLESLMSISVHPNRAGRSGPQHHLESPECRKGVGPPIGLPGNSENRYYSS